MKKRKIKNIFLSGVLVLCMVAGMSPMWDTTVRAADTDKAMMMGMSGIQSWDKDANDLANTDKVVMGKHNSTDLAYWVVLDDSNVGSGSNYISSGAGKFMFSTRVFGESAFQSSGSGTYPGSNLQSAMNTFYGINDFSGTGSLGLTTTEKTAIAQTTLAGSSMFTGVADLIGQQFFPLEQHGTNINEVDAYIGHGTELALGDITSSWWSRTNHQNDSQVFHVFENGSPNYFDTLLSRTHGVRPAFNLDTSKVLFTSAAENGKTPYNNADDTLVKISDTAPTVWKLTLLEAGRNSFVLDSGDAIINGNNVSFYYSGATEGSNEYISVMIVDRSGAITHYAKVSSALSGLNILTSFEIPSEMAGNINLKVFNELVNGNNETDYSSPLRDMTVTIPAAVSYHLTNLSSNNTATTFTATTDYTTTLSADTGYVLPQAITVSVGGTPLTSGYTYSALTGALTIPTESITGAISITADATALVVNNLQSVTQGNVAYGTAVNPQVAYSGSATSSNGGAVVLAYKLQTEPDTAYTNTAPQYVGNYTVRATSAATATTLAGEKTDDFSITAIAQTPTISTTGSVISGNDIDLSTLVTGEQGVVSFALSSGGGRLNGTTYTAPNTAETATFDVTISEYDAGGSADAEYSTYTGTLNVSVTAALAITNGANQTITQGQSISFTSNDDFGGYEDTRITPSGGTEQIVHTAGNDNANASAVNGSITVTLSGTYTATLPVGTHSISINSARGSARTIFTVVAPPATPLPTVVTGHPNPQTGIPR